MTWLVGLWYRPPQEQLLSGVLVIFGGCCTTERHTQVPAEMHWVWALPDEGSDNEIEWTDE